MTASGEKSIGSYREGTMYNEFNIYARLAAVTSHKQEVTLSQAKCNGKMKRF